MLRLLIAYSLALVLYSSAYAQPGGDPAPCPKPTPDRPCNPVFAEYKLESVINAEKFGISQLTNPFGITTEADGRIYVAEYYDYSPSKVFIYNADGSLYKIFDTGLWYLFSIAVDAAGNIYVGGIGQVRIFDSQGNLLRSIDANGGGDDQFYYAWDLEVDAAGNIYVLDYITKIVVYNKDGVHSYTIPNTYSTSIALDKNGELWMADYAGSKLVRYSGNQPVQVIEGVFAPISISFGESNMLHIYHYKEDYSSFALSTFYQGTLLVKTDLTFYTWGNITAAELGYVYFTDYSNSRLLKINIFSGEYTELVNNDLPGTLYYSGPIDSDQDGNVYVFDRPSQPRLQVFDIKGNPIAQYEDVIYPSKIEVDNGVVYALSGNAIFVYGNGVLLNTLNLSAIDLAVYQNQLYILDALDGLIKVYSSAGEFQRSLANNYSQFEIGPSGEIFINNNDTIRVLSNNGDFIKDLAIPVTGLNFIVDDTGYIYVNYVCSIWIYSPDGTLVQKLNESCNYEQWLAGNFSVSNGRLYASDGWHNRIDVFSNLPAIQVGDRHVNYKDGICALPEFVLSNNPVSYKIVSGDAMSFLNETQLNIEHVGNMVMEASVEASLTMRKSSDGFTVDVDKASATITAENKSRPYHTSNPELTLAYSGFREGETSSALTSLPTITTAADQNSNAGEYEITVNGGSADNYEFTYISGVLTITKANQEIIFDELPSPVNSDADPFAISATASSELPVTFSIASGPATLNGNIITLSGEGGSVTVQASQSGNENYIAAPPVSRSFLINLITGFEDAVEDLKIYPNPAREALWLSAAQGINFQLLNARGVPVVQHYSFSNDHVIMTEALSEGMYLLVVQTATGRKITRKISIIK